MLPPVWWGIGRASSLHPDALLPFPPRTTPAPKAGVVFVMSHCSTLAAPVLIERGNVWSAFAEWVGSIDGSFYG